jgi:hypothetical protein
MRTVHTSYALTAAAILTMVTGCSGGTVPNAPPTLGQAPADARSIGIFLPNLAQRDAREPGGLYVAQFGTGFVTEYPIPAKGAHPRCSDSLPAGGINGIAVDSHRMLYVPYNLNSTHDVVTFGPDCGASGPTLVDPNGEVGDVAVDNKRNAVYVSNANTGNIEVYKNGATLPTGELSNSQYHGSGFGVAVDRYGNVFNSGGTIVEFPHGHNKGSKALALSGLTGPLGLSFDSSNNLLVTNEYNIVIYAPPYTGAPKQTITTNPFCLYSAVDAQNKNLYVSEQTNNAVDVYTYPSGAFEYSITSGIQPHAVSGVALDRPSKR